jgi:hypothetical protein
MERGLYDEAERLNIIYINAVDQNLEVSYSSLSNFAEYYFLVTIV